MEPGQTTLIIVLFLLLLCSAFFSASETAYSSLNRIRLKSMQKNGNQKAGRTLELASRYDKLLSSILIGNNLVNIASTSIATMLFVSWFGTAGATISTIVMTILVLLIGEITPKTIAKEMPERFAIRAAPVLRGLLFLLTPINACFSAWKRLLVKLFRIPKSRGVTEQELLTYVGEVRAEGGINAAEEGMIRSVIEFDDLQAIEVCTPRVDIQAVEISDSLAKISEAFQQTGYSRLPVYRETIDAIVGMIRQRDFHYQVQQQGLGMDEIMRPIYYCTKSMKISKLLEELQRKKSHMAVILDEFGGTMGIVTVEDILEELVGEIWDEDEEATQEIMRTAPGQYTVAGRANLDDLFQLFSLPRGDTQAITAGGWVSETLGRIPSEGDVVFIQGLEVTILQMERKRIKQISVRRPATDSQKDSP